MSTRRFLMSASMLMLVLGSATFPLLALAGGAASALHPAEGAAYSFRGFRTRQEYERVMEIRCGRYHEVGMSGVFGAPSEYHDLYPRLGSLHAEIEATRMIADRTRAQVADMLQQVKQEIDRSMLHMEASRRAEAMAEQDINRAGMVVPQLSVEGNRRYRDAEQAIIARQKEEGLSSTMRFLHRADDARWLDQCRQWWEYEQRVLRRPASPWFQ